MNVLPLRNVLYGRPRSQISSRNLMNALKANLLPSVIKNVHVIGIRCVFDFIDRREAVQQLAARRRLLEKKLRESNEVCTFIFLIFFCFLELMFTVAGFFHHHNSIQSVYICDLNYYNSIF